MHGIVLSERSSSKIVYQFICQFNAAPTSEQTILQIDKQAPQEG
jgi:hypothetical protein